MEEKVRIDKHIELRVPAVEMAEEKYRAVMNSHDYLLPWLGWAHYYEKDGLPTMQKFQEEQAKKFKDSVSYAYDIFYDGKFAGSIDLKHYLLNKSVYEIGYWLDKDMSGRGIMTAAANKITELAFDKLGQHRVVIRAASGNKPSRAVAERCGYTLEGELRDAIILEGEYHNEVIYGKING